ncbi:MAG: biotin/lipoyl-containing protein [Bacteroidota bacterium]
MSSLKVLVEEQSFDVQQKDGQVFLNNEPFDWDLLKIDEGRFQIIHQDKSYNVQVEKIDTALKTITFLINGSRITSRVQDRLDLVLQKLGLDKLVESKLTNLKAPMPGLILDVKVSEGDSVEKGDSILVLEAMKMENVIKSPGPGKIKDIKVQKGDSVEKNGILIEFE